MKRLRGFSLLELLLVLAILSVLTTAGLAAYQQHMQNFRIDKAALQMQQWLEAGIAYRSDPANNYKWPNSAQELVDKNYMPSGSLINGPFCPPESVGTTCYAVQPYPSPTDPKQLQVIATITANTKELSQKIAGLIAARLPNATNLDSKGNPTSNVYAYAVLPSIASGSSGFVSAEMVNSQTPQVAHTCPAGQIPHVYFGLSFFRVPKTGPSQNLGDQLQLAQTTGALTLTPGQAFTPTITNIAGVRAYDSSVPCRTDTPEGWPITTDKGGGCPVSYGGTLLMIRTCEPAVSGVIQQQNHKKYAQEYVY